MTERGSEQGVTSMSLQHQPEADSNVHADTVGNSSDANSSNSSSSSTPRVKWQAQGEEGVLTLLPALHQKPRPRPALCTMWIGPGMSKDPRFPDACPKASFYVRRKIGPPGGTVCQNASSLAACLRFDG